MPLTLTHNRLQQLIEEPFPALSPHELRREGAVFFIGGNLPVSETLETMYESYCQESTGLFHVTFAALGDLERNLELVRQIKKNFSVRLMGRITCEVTASIVERAYLAGLDLLDIPHVFRDGAGDPGGLGHNDRQALFTHAVNIFPRWSVVSSLNLGEATAEKLRHTIDSLLASGVVPLPGMIKGAAAVKEDEALAAFAYLVAVWQGHEVQIKALLPLVRLITPLDSSEPAGFIRGVISRIQDRHQLAASDLRRHLRTSGAEASFESAGL